MTAPTPGQAQAQNAVREMIAPLVQQAKQLTDVVAADGVQRRRDNRRVLAVAVALLVVMGLQLTLLIQNRQRSLQNSEILRNSANTSQQMADCTTAGGVCYQEGQKRTAKIMQQLLQTNLYIAQCARQTDTDADLEKCVQAKVQQAAATATPTPNDAQDSDVTP